MISTYLAVCVSRVEGLSGFTLSLRATSKAAAKAQAELIVGAPSDPQRVADIEFVAER